MLKKLLIALGLIEDKKKAPTLAKFIEELNNLPSENVKVIKKPVKKAPAKKKAVAKKKAAKKAK